MIKNKFVSLDVVVQAIREHKIGEYDSSGKYKDDPEHFDIYWKASKNKPELSDVIYVGEPEYVDEEAGYEDIDFIVIPDLVKEKGWELLYGGQLVEDVVISANSQKPNLGNSEILKAIKYYMHHDCFYDFINLESNVGQL